MRQRGIP